MKWQVCYYGKLAISNLEKIIINFFIGTTK